MNGNLLSSLQIISPGVLNHDAGPDFANATICMDGLMWHGNIELHLNSNDWYLHNHHTDPAYNNVILHVVLNGEEPVQTESGAWIPTIKVSRESLVFPVMHAHCVSEQMLGFLANERLMRYAAMYGLLLNRVRNNSYQALFTWLAMGFGRPQNDFPFEQLFKPVKFESFLRLTQEERLMLLSYYSGLFPHQVFSTSSLSWIQNTGSRLGFSQMQLHQWKRSRMRPVNLPSNRLLQFNELLSKHAQVISAFSGQGPLVESSNSFVQLCKSLQKGAGNSFINKLLINAWLPALVQERQRKGDSGIAQEAINYIGTLPPEDNYLLRSFSGTHQLKLNNALQSQGALEYLYHDSYMN